LSAEPIGGSVFIAAFVAGLAVQVGYKDAPERAVDFSQNWGQLLNVFVFFLFGLIVGTASWHFSWLVALCAVLSLTVVRMVPVAISLIGTRLSAATVSFMGWFGPRGLASIVLGLIFLEQEIHLPGEPILRMAMMMTVLISIFAHGLSASPGIRLYAQRLSKQPPDAPELKASPEPQHR
jgi:NhaP-type Na+/H+ or K+/H+ antiporter